MDDAGRQDDYPSRAEVLDYLAAYERRYELPVRRPVRVDAVHREGDGFRVVADAGTWRAKAVVSATGTWTRPFMPDVPGRDEFQGVQLHSARYATPDAFAGRRVLVVGAGNSGAQILAEVSRVADATWVTLAEPAFLPDWVDGRYLFGQATAAYRALQEGREPPPRVELGDIVMVPPVREARDRGARVRSPLRADDGGWRGVAGRA